MRIIPKGTSAFALYPALALAGLIDPRRFDLLHEDPLRPVLHHGEPGIDASVLKMGTQLEQGIGMALVGKYSGENFPVLVFLSDGDLQLALDHAAKFSAKMELSNLAVVLDANELQSSYRVDTVDSLMEKDADGLYSKLRQVWEAYGWDVIEIDGHDYSQIESALRQAGKRDRPLLIIARTIKGKGIPFMEGKLYFNHRLADPQQIAEAQGILAGHVIAFEARGNNVSFPSSYFQKRAKIPFPRLKVPSVELELDKAGIDDVLKPFLKQWIERFVELNPGVVFTLNTDVPAPLDQETPVYTPRSPTPHLFLGINERFALNVARGITNEQRFPIYMTTTVHNLVNAEEWRLVALGLERHHATLGFAL